MILLRVREYLRERRQATLDEIARHCHSDPQAVRGMLDVWIRKGKVVCQVADVRCGVGCNSCGCKPAGHEAGREIYIWQDGVRGAADSRRERGE